MNHALILNPEAPPPQIVLFTLLIMGLAIWLYYRGAGTGSSRTRILTVLRCMSIVTITFLLLNPVLTLSTKEIERPPLLVLIDSSHSMSIADVAGQRRFDAARDAVIGSGTDFGALRKHFTVQLYQFSDTSTRCTASALDRTIKPVGMSTKIGEALSGAVGNQPAESSGAALIVSDGRNNGEFDPVEAARESRERGFPVFTICVGSNAHGENATIMNRRPQVYAAPGQTVALTAEMTSVGLNGQTAHLQLTDGAGDVVATQDYTMDDNAPVPVSFPITQNAVGNYRYTIAIVPIPGEVTVADNKTSVYLQVIKNKARVLVLEARPTWDAKFLLQALRSDPTISVDAIFKVSDDKYFALKQQDNVDTSSTSDDTDDASSTVAVPTTAADLAHYDVVIIGKGYSDLFGPSGVAALEDYVANHAGNLIFLRGKPEESDSDTLHQLEPMDWTADQIANIELEVTQEGRSNPAFDFSDHPDPQLAVHQLPSLESATRVVGEKALSVVLARSTNVSEGSSAQEMAVLAYQNYGQGKVVALAGEGLWHWALLPPAMSGYSDCFDEFWTQTVRWLVNQSDFLPGEDVTLKTDRSAYAPGDTVDLLAFTRGDNKTVLPPVTITDPDGHDEQVLLAKAPLSAADFAGVYRALKPGEYVASMARNGDSGGIIRIPFSVYPGTEEDLITAADPAAMLTIARAGGGEALTADEMDTLPNKVKSAQEAIALRTEPETAWDHWWVLTPILCLLTTEWILRRRSGLI